MATKLTYGLPLRWIMPDYFCASAYLDFGHFQAEKVQGL